MFTAKQESEALKRYGSLAEEIAAAGISEKEKELAAVAISVAAGCGPCTDYHLKAAAGTGAESEEIRAAADNGLRVRADAVAAMREFCDSRLGGSNEAAGAGRFLCNGGRIEVLSGLGAAFAANCVKGLEVWQGAAEKSGISDAEMKAAARLAAFIKKMAHMHAAKVAGIPGDDAGAGAGGKNKGCGC